MSEILLKMLLYSTDFSLWKSVIEWELLRIVVFHSPTYKNERMALLDTIKSINCDIFVFSDAVVTKILLFGDDTLSASSNALILNSEIDYIISTTRFDGSILTHE